MTRQEMEDRMRVLEAMIMGLIDAQRPLLDEWRALKDKLEAKDLKDSEKCL